MDIGKLPNYNFYSGFEGEPEIILYMDGKEDFSLHIWEGFFDDIFGNAPLNGLGWTGFTRDYQQCERTFPGEGSPVSINIDEYLSDLLQYRGCSFHFEETTDCLELICNFLTEAKGMNYSVEVSVL